MQELIIVGQSPAVVAFIRTLREGDQDRAITLISTDGNLPYDRSLFPKLIGQKIREKEIFCQGEDFFAAHKVNLVLDKEITRIGLNRRKVFLADRLQLDYDDLVLCDAPQPRLPEKKGVRRIGVFSLARLDSVRRLLKYLPFTETAVVEASSLLGVETALALKGTGKEVLVLLPGEKPLAGILGDEEARLLLCLLERRGIRVLSGSQIEDILGETELKAVRLDSGKVLACEMVILDDAAPDLRFLSSGELLLDTRIMVQGTLQTNIPRVYALDAMGVMESPRIPGGYSLPTPIGVSQAEVAARNILGKEVLLSPEMIPSLEPWEDLFSPDERAAAREVLLSASPESALASGTSLAEGPGGQG